MEVFDSNSTVITRSLQHRLGGIKKLLRIVEIFLILVLISWSFSRIPLLVRVSRDYFVMLANAVLSPLFIFLVSNVIGLSLFFFFKSQGDSSGEAHMDFYSEIICNYSEDCYYRCKLFDDEVMTTSTVESCSAVVYQDKQTIVEVMKKKEEEEEETTTVSVEDCRKRSAAAAENDGGRCVDIADVEEEMSDEEFHRAIEAFIAKQVKFHKEEKFDAIVPHGGIHVINEN